MVSVIQDPRLKKKCQTFTPTEIVTQMLDEVGYKQQLVGKMVLENCCGDGQFLVRIVESYIEDAVQSGLTPQRLIEGLEHDIIAYELDEELIKTCKKRLDEVAAQHELRAVRWNIRLGNFLSADIQEQFDYIIGNPPYIAYQDLPQTVRKELKKEFRVCQKGKYDYSYAFIEKSYQLLRNGGKLAYIIPNNLFKNVFAAELRNLIKADLVEVVDYPLDKVFEDALVSPSVMIVEKGTAAKRFRYIKRVNEISETKTVAKKDLSEKWIFDTVMAAERKVGDYFKVSNAVATLCNRAFILKEGHFEGKYFLSGEEKIESAVVKKAASPKSKRYHKETPEYIVFPYRYDTDGSLFRYSESEFLEKFPYAAQHLERFMPELEARDADGSAKWFEYGRSQALQTIDQEMLLISSVISDKTEAYYLSKDEVPYAGIYIVPTGDIPLEELLRALNSDRFKQYASSVGVSVSGCSKRLATKDIEKFTF